MLAVGMPSSAARPGTAPSPGPTPVSTAGPPFSWPPPPRGAVEAWAVRRGRVRGRPLVGGGGGLRPSIAEPGVSRSRRPRAGGRPLPAVLQLRGEERLLRSGGLLLAARRPGGVAGALEPL